MALVRLIVAVALLNLCFLHSGVALRWQEDCIDAPQDQPCFNVRNDWARFRAKVERANDGETIVFCPFEVTSDGTGVRPKTKASLVCQHQHSCIVRGPGRLMHLHRTMTEVSVVGFRFEGATDAAVYISQRSRKKQSFCKCEFARNMAAGRGAVFRTGKSTNLEVRHCLFTNNSASRGGAVYGRGSATMDDSTFADNRAQGGAIAIANYATKLQVARNTFVDNEALAGAAIFAEDISAIESVYVDGGGNIATGTPCQGLLLRNANDVCIYFEHPTIPSKPSTRPTITTSPAPTSNPSDLPTVPPSTDNPSSSLAPTMPTRRPSSIPSTLPSQHPSSYPTRDPLSQPSLSFDPSIQPSPTPSASMKPTNSAIPTKSLTPSTTNKPSSQPSKVPSASMYPSQKPSKAPSPPPTLRPTNEPTSYSQPRDPQMEVLPLVDRVQPPGYFNWNMADPDFGPQAWGDVEVGHNDFSRYEESGLRVSTNECGRGGRQSPIELWRTNAACDEFHQIRARGGDWRNLTREGEITFQVLPSVLRIQFDGVNPKRPRADSPGGFAPIYTSHLEITTPSLHTLNGQRFDAEYSLYHVQGSKNRILVLSVVIDASVNEFNPQMQKLLIAWSRVRGCGLENGRRLTEMDLTAETDDDEEFVRGRHLQHINGKFNIFHIDLVPSIYWFAYSGSLPRPPCSRNTHWRVMDVPMKIDHNQLRLLKSLLRNGPCKDHPFRQGLGSVLARPAQPTRNRPVWRCTPQDYLSDCERFGSLCPAPEYP